MMLFCVLYRIQWLHHASETSQPVELNDAEKKIAGIQQDEEDREEDESEYPKAGALALITAALCLSIFCMALDNTIISTAVSLALPRC